MVLTNDDFEDARGALLRLQVRAMKDARGELAHLISGWLYELETQRWLATRSMPKEAPVCAEWRKGQA